MRIYGAMYCFCIHESGFEVISLHKSIEGAASVIEKHRNENLGYSSFSEWKIEEFEILD